jgi:hypothetical protein
MGCVGPTGEPGGLVRYGDDVEESGTLELLQADSTGLHTGATVPIDRAGTCESVSLRASGTGIAVSLLPESKLRAILRTGGTWGAPAEVLDDPAVAGLGGLDADVSDAGAAVVAVGSFGEKGYSVRVVRRAPDAAFGAAETLFSVPRAQGSGSLQAGVTATGETIVAWSLRRGFNVRRELWATVAGPGEAFRTPVRIGEPGGAFALAVGDGGHALVAFASDNELRVAERGPGATFGLAAPVGIADDPLFISPTAAVRADGAAVVGWAGYIDGSMRAVARPGPGAFGPQVEIARRLPLGLTRTLLEVAYALDDEDDVGFEFESPLTNAGTALLPGDRALLTWSATHARDGVFSIAPQAALLPLGGGPAEHHPLGGGLRDVSAVAPVVLADGRGAVAWAEELGQDGDEDDRWRGDEAATGTLHLAVEGVADAAEPPAPRVRIAGPKPGILDADDGIALRVTCSAACDVQASAGNNALDANGQLRLRRAGTGRLYLRPELRPIARLDGKPVAIRVRYGAPGARHPRSRTLSVRLRRPPGEPLPHVRGAQARRDGGDIVVTWRAERDADADNFVAYATAGPRSTVMGAALATGSGGRYRARIRDVASARSVSVLTGADDAGVLRRTTVELTP